MTYVRMAMLAGVLAALIGAYFIGDRAGANRVIARDAKAMAKAIAVQDKARQAIETLNGRVAEAQRDQGVQTQEIYRETVRIVDRPVYRNQCVDADGGRLLTRAYENANRGLAPVVAAGDAAAPAADASQR